MSSHGGGGASSLPHSHSSPSGIYPTPSSPEGRSLGKRLPVQVHFLDDSVASFNIQFKALGKVLFDQVCKMLNLLETDYFGLEYIDCAGTKFWLDYEKPMCRQMGLSMINPIMSFCVKFYTPDPAQLEEEYTRYLFSLQVKRDLAQGVLICNDNTAALMASYIVQAECGDFVSEDYPDHTYVSSFKFVPHQDAEFQHKIMENHKKHTGQSPAEADLNLLETSRRCELYGIKMTPAKDSEGVPLNLAAAHMGVLVFQNFTKINTFSWAKIRKISFKRRKFLIKLHPEGYGYYKDTVEFVFESRNECKNFWKKCIENHAFFRCSEVKRLPRQKTRIFSRGSSFRYSGRTQKQMVEYVRENYVKRQPFQRSTSLRVSSTTRRGLGMVGTSLSAQPLLPVSSSQSCGSVILSHDVEVPSALVTRPTSASQPSSPRVNQESSRMLANGNICIDSRGSYLERRDLPPGLQSSKFNKDIIGGHRHSPDLISNYSEENYSDNFSDHYLSDNTSHNSYSLDHKHSLSDSVVYQNCRDTLTLSDNKSDRVCNISSDSKAPFDTKQSSLGSEGEVAKGELLSNLVKDLSEICNQSSIEGEGVDDEVISANGEIMYVLHKLDKSPKSLPSLLKPQKPKSPKPVLRVEVEHALKAHGSPTLFARAGCFSTSKKNKYNYNVKNLMRSKTVDFVSVSQLPATDSFSSQDDSLEDSVGKVLKECQRKCNSEPIRGKEMLKNFSSKQSSTDSQDMDYVVSNKDGSYYRFATDDLTDSIEMIISKKQGKGKLAKFRQSVSNVSFEAPDNLDSKCPLEYPLHSEFAADSCVNGVTNTENLTVAKNDSEDMDEFSKDIWLNHDTEEYLSDSSSGSGILCSGSSTSSLDEMLQLSDLRLYDTHLSSSEEDPTVADDDEFDQSHIADYNEENLSKPSQSPLMKDIIVNEDEENDENDENSLNEAVDVLEDITEHTETFSEGETAQIIDDNLSCGSTRSIESIPSTPSKKQSSAAVDMERAFESPPPYQSPAKDLSSPVSQPRSSSNVHSETTSISTRCISSDEEMSRSPTSPLRSLREQCSTAHSPRSETDTEIRRKRVPADKSYFIAKELLMTERTYKKDLELLNVWFRDEVSKEENMPTEALAVLFTVVDPLYEFHCSFLRELEHRIATWEGKTGMPLQSHIQGIGDIMLQKVQMSEFYTNYIDKLPFILERLNAAYCSNSHFERMYCDFEMQRVCYLPLTSFLLRPAHRLMHYTSLLERLIKHNGESHPDTKNCKTVLYKFKQVTSLLLKNISYASNYVKLMELQRDLHGIDNLTSGRREFLREGCLQKLSRKGYQNRMFFLFSDVLLYTSKAPTAQLQFKVHGQLPLQGVMTEETEPKMGVTSCFTIYGGNRALMVAASSGEERVKWLKDLNETVLNSNEPKDESLFYSSLRSCSSSEELLEQGDGFRSSEIMAASSGSAKPYQHRSNTTVHVCWHRNTSVGRDDYRKALLNYLSGYLLRKFKNSSGWQKLWVVFTNFCLFFYKSYQDDCPLASLPLLGYAVTLPNPHDNINKDFVFKLQFKNHIYFFRAESEYTFERWVDVIKSATLKS